MGDCVWVVERGVIGDGGKVIAVFRDLFDASKFAEALAHEIAAKRRNPPKVEAQADDAAGSREWYVGVDIVSVGRFRVREEAD